MNPHNGDLFIGDDPTVVIAVNPPLNMGHIFTIKGDGTATAPADCTGSATTTCAPPAPPSTVTPQLYAYGLTAPKGGVVFVPSDDGGHIWAADESAGLCRFDTVAKAPGLHAYNPAACDDGSVLGSGGQTVYDDSVVTGTTNQHYLYVAQNDHLSPGVLRFTFDPSLDNGAGDLVPNSAVIMAPNAGLNGDKDNGLALGPCKPGAPVTCKHSLYVGGPARRVHPPDQQPGGRPAQPDRRRGRDDHRAAGRHLGPGHQRFDGHDRRRPVPAGGRGLHGRQEHHARARRTTWSVRRSR